MEKKHKNPPGNFSQGCHCAPYRFLFGRIQIFNRKKTLVCTHFHGPPLILKVLLPDYSWYPIKKKTSDAVSCFASTASGKKIQEYLCILMEISEEWQESCWVLEMACKIFTAGDDFKIPNRTSSLKLTSIRTAVFSKPIFCMIGVEFSGALCKVSAKFSNSINCISQCQLVMSLFNVTSQE